MWYLCCSSLQPCLPGVKQGALAYPEMGPDNIGKSLGAWSWDCFNPLLVQLYLCCLLEMSLERALPQAVPACLGKTQGSPKRAPRVKQREWAEIQSFSLVSGSLQHRAGTIWTVLVLMHKSWPGIRSRHGSGTLSAGRMGAGVRGCSVSTGFCVPVGLSASTVPSTFRLQLLAAILMPLDVVSQYYGHNNPNKELYLFFFL